MTQVRLLYFASLRDAAGVSAETVQTQTPDLRALYVELQLRHRFALPVGNLRVAVNGVFARWDDVLVCDSEIAFIPPVSGG